VTALCAAGWVVAALAVVRALVLRRRLELVANAAHELRGAAAALSLAVASLRREPGGIRRARALEAQLERMRAGLADLEAARRGRRAVARPVVLPVERLVRSAAAGRGLRVRWQAGAALVRADRGRLAQLICNLVDNAVEHGSGTVDLTARRSPRGVLIELTNPAGTGASRAPGRGRGLGIAARAAADAGGTLAVDSNEDGTIAAVELPLAEP
jgi:signal transduction histidine kinase